MSAPVARAANVSLVEVASQGHANYSDVAAQESVNTVSSELMNAPSVASGAKTANQESENVVPPKPDAWLHDQQTTNDAP
jgi:hypothetical protein